MSIMTYEHLVFAIFKPVTAVQFVDTFIHIGVLTVTLTSLTIHLFLQRQPESGFSKQVPKTDSQAQFLSPWVPVGLQI